MQSKTAFSLPSHENLGTLKKAKLLPHHKPSLTNQAPFSSYFILFQGNSACIDSNLLIYILLCLINLLQSEPILCF